MGALADWKPSQEEFESDYPEDFGNGIRGNWYSFQGVSHAGIIVAHIHPDGTLCAGAVPIKGRDFPGYPGATRPMWNMINEDPLTLNPSIHDPSCGLHGFIREGKWVNA